MFVIVAKGSEVLEPAGFADAAERYGTAKPLRETIWRIGRKFTYGPVLCPTTSPLGRALRQVETCRHECSLQERSRQSNLQSPQTSDDQRTLHQAADRATEGNTSQQQDDTNDRRTNSNVSNSRGLSKRGPVAKELTYNRMTLQDKSSVPWQKADRWSLAGEDYGGATCTTEMFFISIGYVRMGRKRVGITDTDRTGNLDSRISRRVN